TLPSLQACGSDCFGNYRDSMRHSDCSQCRRDSRRRDSEPPCSVCQIFFPLLRNDTLRFWGCGLFPTFQNDMKDRTQFPKAAIFWIF
ncbi:hypothetical protein CEXT_410251, partial [Caerostris extrusa]